MKRYLAGLFAILLCMGQGCPNIGIPPGAGGGNNNGGNNGGNQDGNGGSTQQKGVPEGVYTGLQTTVRELDNLSDAYPPDVQSTSGTTTVTFGKDGRLLRGDGSPIALGDVEISSTGLGQVAEQVSAITLGTKLTEYRTLAQMTMQGSAGLSWNFSGTGTHTYRLTGGNVVYDGVLDLTSDTAGGVSFRLIIEYSAELAE